MSVSEVIYEKQKANDQREVYYQGNRRRAIRKLRGELPKTKDRVLLCVKVSKTIGESLGITIVGGAGSYAKSVYVKSVDPLGVCSRNGSLHVGDQILMVNDHSFRGITHAQAVQHFKRCKTEIKFIISRMLEKKEHTENYSPFDSYHVFASPSYIEEPILLEHKNLIHCR